MQVDKFGMTVLVDRETGQDHVCTAVSAREILRTASPASDKDPRYVVKADWDGLLAKDAKVAKKAAEEAAKAEAERKAAEEKARRDAEIEAEIEKRKRSGKL
jgi:hypothetical protein